MNSTFRTLVWLPLTGCVVTTGLQAASISSSATATSQCFYATSYLTPLNTTYPGPDITNQITASGTNSAAPACAPSVFPPANPPLTPLSSPLIGSSSASASGSATYGTIRGASIAQDGLTGILQASANFTGSFDDALTITGGSGIARFIWVLKGRGNGEPGTYDTHNTHKLYVDGILRSTLVLPSVNAGTQTFLFDRPFSSGDIIPFQSAVFLPATTPDLESNNSDLRLFIQFLDNNGAPLNGLTASSDSGTVYQATPEPGNSAMVVMGFVLCAAGLARRRANG